MVEQSVQTQRSILEANAAFDSRLFELAGLVQNSFLRMEAIENTLNQIHNRTEKSIKDFEKNTPDHTNKTSAASNNRKPIRCSFCGKHEQQVHRMIQGPGVRICDECVHLCTQILNGDFDDADDTSA